MAAHPDDHARDDADGDERDDRLEPLLLAVRQLAAENLERQPDAKAEPGRQHDARPHPAEHVAASLLAQERGDDADDQGRLDALRRPMTNVGITPVRENRNHVRGTLHHLCKACLTRMRRDAHSPTTVRCDIAAMLSLG